MGYSKGGSGVIKLFFLLSALAGLFVLTFPLIEKRMPDLAEKVNSFRGYYTGVLFSKPKNPGDKDYFTEEFRGFKDVIQNQNLYYLIPAADVKLIFYGYFNSPDSILQLNLYRADNIKTVIATNLDIPFEKGRQAGAVSLKGEDIPDHANWFSFKCRKGVEYVLKALPENTTDIGKNFIVRAEADGGWISIPGLWILFEVILLVLLGVYYIYKFLSYAGKRK